MTSNPRPLMDAILEWGGGAALGAACASAFWLAGAGVPATVAAGLAALAGGRALLATIGRGTEPGYDLDLVPFAFAEADAPLLLDDPILPPERDSRVVQLFASAAETPLPQPGELAARIDSWLGEGRSGQLYRLPVAPAVASPDARAELHQAIAEIRRSLR